MKLNFKDEVFEQAFEKAELANLGQADLEQYELNLKAYRDYKSSSSGKSMIVSR